MKVIYVDRSVKEPDVYKKVFEEKSDVYRVLTDLHDCTPEEIDIAIIWLHVPIILKSFTNLEMILVCGSGIDHIIDKNTLPDDVPIVRLVDFDLRKRVANYVVDDVINYQNKINNAQYDTWAAGDRPNNMPLKKPPLKVGIMGLGLIGSTIARVLERPGIEIFGWVRTTKERVIKNVFTGRSSLTKFAKQCKIIICQLPLTPATKGILNKELFYSMPKGGYIINVGRGEHLNEEDLLEAIATGHLLGASLDVFKVEPLPEDHPFHKNENIKITPHVAGIIDPEKQASYALGVVKDFYNKEQVEGMVIQREKY